MGLAPLALVLGMSEQVLLFLIGQVVTAAGVYAAIRADLRECMVRISILEGRG